MDDLTTALEESRVREMFGSGTACVVCPVSKVLYKGEVRPPFFTSYHFKHLPVFKCVNGSSCRGAAETNPTRNHKVEGLLSGLAQWVKNLVLP